MNETLRIGFRVDSGDTIGTGHVMEISSLINQLRKHIFFEPVVLTSNNDFAISKFREAEINNINLISAGASEETELEEILAVLSQHGVSHLVIDLINRSDDFYGFLHQRLPSTCVILDNNEHKELAASVVVNFSVTQDPAWYQTATAYETRYLIGPRYFFWDEAIQGTQKRHIRPEVDTVLVNQGGSDPYGLTVKILRALEAENLPQKFLFVLGGHIQEGHRAELEKMRNCLNSKSVFFDNLPRNALYRLMQASDMAISAAGNTLYELLYIGVPTLVISHHRMHDEVAKAFKRQGAVINLGIGDELAEGHMVAALRDLAANYDLRQRLQRSGQNLFGNEHGPTLVDELVRLYT
jgi:spore coat polysaccharide biosynthesis predicted glycosyltransferase SpsG